MKFLLYLAVFCILRESLADTSVFLQNPAYLDQCYLEDLKMPLGKNKTFIKKGLCQIYYCDEQLVATVTGCEAVVPMEGFHVSADDNYEYPGCCPVLLPDAGIPVPETEPEWPSATDLIPPPVAILPHETEPAHAYAAAEAEAVISAQHQK